MPHVTSANIACGAHAGDTAVMRADAAAGGAARSSLRCAPGFADLAGFGRREIPVTPTEAGDLVLYQLGALAAIAASEGVRLSHVKAHGALYNMAARDRALADAIASAIASFDRSLTFFGLAGSGMLDAGRKAGLTVAAEGFADRAYEADGSLTSAIDRRVPLSTDVDAVVARAVRWCATRRVQARNGAEIPLQVDTICVHGDTPGSRPAGAALRAGLERPASTSRLASRSPRLRRPS